MILGKSFFKDNWQYIAIFVVGLIVIITNRIISGFNGILVVSDFASLFAMFYIIFNAKNSVLGLVFNLISTALVAVSSFYQHIWLNGFICVCINIPMFIFGIITWKKKLAKQTSKVRINKLSKKALCLVFLGFVSISVALLFILKALNGNLYYLDAFYSAGSVIGVILMSLAYFDQFYILYFANIAGVAMYIILCFQNLNNIPLLFMNLMFFVGNIIAHINWSKLYKKMKTKNDLSDGAGESIKQDDINEETTKAETIEDISEN